MVRYRLRWIGLGGIRKFLHFGIRVVLGIARLEIADGWMGWFAKLCWSRGMAGLEIGGWMGWIYGREIADGWMGWIEGVKYQM